LGEIPIRVDSNKKLIKNDSLTFAFKDFVGFIGGTRVMGRDV
jgi:hypothetical protein